MRRLDILYRVPQGPGEQQIGDQILNLRHCTCYIPKILSGIHLECFEKPPDFVGDPSVVQWWHALCALRAGDKIYMPKQNTYYT